jgi:hypothetical protein
VKEEYIPFNVEEKKQSLKNQKEGVHLGQKPGKKKRLKGFGFFNLDYKMHNFSSNTFSMKNSGNDVLF